MEKIQNLWHLTNKWYDYPVNGGERRSYRIHTPKPFRVYHIDGTFSLAYSYGEYHFTYDLDELAQKRAENAQKTAHNKERAELMKYFEGLTNDELRRIINERRG